MKTNNIVIGISSDNTCMNLSNIPTGRLEHFYLHGKLETNNGYDICEGNINMLTHCTSTISTICDVYCTDGTIHKAICFKKIQCDQIHGLIVALDDIQGVKEVIKWLKPKTFPSMYDAELKWLYTNYPHIRESVLEYIKKNSASSII